VTESLRPPAALASYCFRPGQSGNPSGLPKNFRRPTDAIRHLVGIRGDSVEEVVARFRTARGGRLCGADHLAITAFLKACDPAARNGDAAFREILDRLEGPLMKSLKVQSEEALTVNVVDLDAMRAGLVSPHRAAELEALDDSGGRRRALQEAALDSEMVEHSQLEESAANGSQDDGDTR
jgi:hypothetical protein